MVATSFPTGLLIFTLTVLAGVVEAAEVTDSPAEDRTVLTNPVRYQVTDSIQPRSVQPLPPQPRFAQPGPATTSPGREVAPRSSPRLPNSARGFPLADRNSNRTTTRFRRASYRLARAPDIFGDFSWTGSAAFQANVAILGAAFVQADVPLAGGSRRTKIAENNRAVPTDRVYFTYNHFHNALESSLAPAPDAPPLTRNVFDVDRYTLGVEKTFGYGDWSLEMRMPFSGRDSVISSNPMNPGTSALELTGGNVGDLALILKRLIRYDECVAISTGVGVTTPTGSDVQSTQPGPAFETFFVQNRAYHILPFLGLTATPRDEWFWHGFAQLDFAANGHRVDVNNVFAPPQSFLLNDQTLLHLDLSAGYWIDQDPCVGRLSGIAALLELHYTTTLQDADLAPLTGGFGALGNRDNRIDVLNLTAGLHAEFQQLHVRVGAVVPLGSANERFFDSEIQVVVNRRF